MFKREHNAYIIAKRVLICYVSHIAHTQRIGNGGGWRCTKHTRMTRRLWSIHCVSITRAHISCARNVALKRITRVALPPHNGSQWCELTLQLTVKQSKFWGQTIKFHNSMSVCAHALLITRMHCEQTRGKRAPSGRRRGCVSGDLMSITAGGLLADKLYQQRTRSCSGPRWTRYTFNACLNTHTRTHAAKSRRATQNPFSNGCDFVEQHGAAHARITCMLCVCYKLACRVEPMSKPMLLLLFTAH